MGQEDVPLGYDEDEDLTQVLIEAGVPVDQPMIPELVEEPEPVQENAGILPPALEPAPMQPQQTLNRLAEELVQLLRSNPNIEYIHIAQSYVDAVRQRIDNRMETIGNLPEIIILRLHVLALQADIEAIRSEVMADAANDNIQ